MREVETVLGSVLAKVGGLSPTTITDVGGFDDKVIQRAYLEQYLPPGLLDTTIGKDILSQAQSRLRGRFVCKASV